MSSKNNYEWNSLTTNRETQNSESDKYATPKKIWKPLADEIGGFDLDPASGCEPKQIADHVYTEQDDGLKQPWYGNVWVNPPYSNPSAWLEKCVDEYEHGDADKIFLLIPNRSNTNYYHDYIRHASLKVELDSKIKFIKNGKAANDYFPTPLMILYFGQVTDDLKRTLSEYGFVWHIPDTQNKISDFY